jgi:hypothetical protein
MANNGLIPGVKKASWEKSWLVMVILVNSF